MDQSLALPVLSPEGQKGAQSKSPAPPTFGGSQLCSVAVQRGAQDDQVIAVVLQAHQQACSAGLCTGQRRREAVEHLQRHGCLWGLRR